jgi:hypothetical protein
VITTKNVTSIGTNRSRTIAAQIEKSVTKRGKEIIVKPSDCVAKGMFKKYSPASWGGLFTIIFSKIGIVRRSESI